MARFPRPRIPARLFTIVVSLLLPLNTIVVSPGDRDAALTTVDAAFPVVTLNKVTSSAGFVHPGIGVSADRVRLARQQVTTGVEPWTSYYDAMVATGYASTTFTSANLGGEVDRPGTDAFASASVQSRFIDDAFRAYTQAILYVITGNPAHRENGMRLIRIWGHMDPAKYRYYPDAHIHAGVPLLRMLAAAELLRYSSVNPGDSGYNLSWEDADTANLTANLVEPLTDTFLYGNRRFMNQHLYGLAGALAGYIFTDNLPRYREGVEWFSVNSTNPDTYANGSLTSLLRRIDRKDPLNHYGYGFIQHQEMGRDQAHAWDDIAKLSEIARLLTIQGTRLDPRKGTISTRRDAVSPYRFGNDRILAGAEMFYAYMMGRTVPWIDTSGRSGVLSEAYRGRVFEPIDELYDVYRYDLGVDVARQAPSVAQMARQADGPRFYWGTSPYNFWNSNPDYNPDHWLSLPEAVAGRGRPVQDDAQVQVENRSIGLDSGSSVREEDGRTFVRMRGDRRGTTIAIRTLMYESRAGHSPVGILLRTNGPTTLQIRKAQNLPPYHTLTVPDTRGQWRYIVYDMDLDLLPGTLAGDNLAYYTVLAPAHVSVDIDSVNLQARSQLSPPMFAQGRRVTVIGVADARLTRSLAATDSAGDTLRYAASGLPSGASLDPSSATLDWSPTSRAVGTHTFRVVASDDAVDTVLEVTARIVATRRDAITAALAGYQPHKKYVKATLAAMTTRRSAAEQAAHNADDGTFAASIVALQDAVADLELLNPQMSGGTLDYRRLVTSPTLTTYAIANMADGDFNSISGDLRAPLVLDFGEGFRVRADAFGLQARWNFANRSEGANVYGSNDGRTWTRLTLRETTNTADKGFAMETIAVRGAARHLTFRFLKVQVDHPGAPTDPAYPGISSFSEFRIDGERVETVQAVSSVSLTADGTTPGRAVNGDAVTLDLVSTRPLAQVTARIEGVDAIVTHTDSTHWRAVAVLPENVDYGRPLQFSVDYTTAAGELGATVLRTTDGTSLDLWNTHVVVAPIQPGWVTASTVAWPGTGTEAANGWRMFDGDVATYTDTTTEDGWVTIRPPGGVTLNFNAVRVRPRSGQPSRANGTAVQTSANGGATWQTVVTFSGVTDDATWYVFSLATEASSPMLRVLDEHNGHVNIAEVQLLHIDDDPA